MKTIKKFIILPLLLTFFLIFAFLRPQKVVAGACNRSGNCYWSDIFYYDSCCTAAKNNSDALDCPSGRYPDYDCESQSGDGGPYTYCWYCTGVADCAHSQYPSCGGSCSSGSCGASEGSCTCSSTPSCNVTAPTGLTYTRISPSSGNLTWTLGAHGTKQKLYAGDNKTKVDTDCPSGIGPGTGCVVKEDSLSSSLNTYTTGDVLSPGTVYYWRVQNIGSCTKNSSTYVSISSCLVSPSSMNLYPRESQTLSTNVNSSVDISVLYELSWDPLIITISPVRSSWYPYSTVVTAYSVGSKTITSSVQNTSGTTICSSIANVIVMAPISWWQVKDSDVFSNGSVISPVPRAATFGLSGLGGFPGVIGYGTIYNFSQGTISSKNWLANTVSSSSRIYDYNYFARQLPQAAIDYLNQHPISSFSQATLSGSDGYLDLVSGLTFYKTTSGGEILIDGNIDVGSSKVVLLAGESDVRISGTINLNDGAGLFVLFVGKDANGNKGNIYIGPTVGGAPGGVPQLEGIYLADGIIYTGSLGADLDSQLYVRGSMAGLSGISFQRDMLDNSIYPSEYFEYAPDQIMNLLNYPAISARKMNWKEVAP